MSENNQLEFSKSPLVEIFEKKKPELIEICISQHFNSIGTVREFRARLSKYFKGKLELNNINETLNEK